MLKKNFNKTYRNINTFKSMKAIFNLASSQTESLYCKFDIFDMNPDLLGFDNGVYDLKKDEFRPIRKEDYITMTTGYDYREATTEEYELWFNYIKKVMPYAEEREFLMRVLSSCLRGETLENFIMLLGKGRNSKDTLITSNLKTVMGDYYRLASLSVLTKELEQTTGSANTELANMSKKRVVIYTEPSKYNNLRGSNIKRLTGSRQITARRLYSSIDNNCSLQGTHILLSQEEASIDNADNAIACRLLKIPFRAQFRTQEVLDKLPEGTKNYYLVNSFYKSDKFIEDVKYAFINRLLEAYRSFKKDGYIIRNIPATIKDLTREFLDDCDEFKTWFNEEYVRVEDVGKFVRIKSIFAKYKQSDLYSNLSKFNKRKCTFSKFVKTLNGNPDLLPYIKERKSINNKDYRNILINYTEREDEDSDNE